MFGPTPPYFTNGSKSSAGLAATSAAMSIEGHPVTTTVSGTSPSLLTRSAAPFVETRCRFDSLVTACLTFSSIDPVTSPPCTWTTGMFMYAAATALASVS